MLKPKYLAPLAVVMSLSAMVPAHAQSSENQRSMQGSQNAAQAENVIKDWKQQPQKVAREMMKKYGQPQEVTAQRLVWHNNGPWKRTELINEEIDHDFPLPHKDMLKQVIAYNVPPDKFDELAAYDGSVVVERTRGEMFARCDKEGANILALNLANDIVTGKRSVEEARKTYGEQMVAFASGKPAPLVEKLTFQPKPNAGFSDKPVLDEATIQKVKAMMKEKEQKMN
jgi:hypothetical protein